MDRREFLKITSVAIAWPSLLGCEREATMSKVLKPIVVPDFSTEKLHLYLNNLLAAYEAKGMKVTNSLLPALSEKQIREECSWFPEELPEEIISLYSWRGGQEEDAGVSESPFLFRDNGFCSLERAQQEYKSMMASYGTNPDDHKMLKYSFPIASFNGGWYVMPMKSHSFNPSLKRPVISVMEGIDVYFYTIESMVATCVDWVNHPKYDDDYSLPNDLEMKIWQKHNPGIFN